MLYSDDGCFPSVQIEDLLIHDFIFYMAKAEYFLTGFYNPHMCSDNDMDKQDFNSWFGYPDDLIYRENRVLAESSPNFSWNESQFSFAALRLQEQLQDTALTSNA